MKEKTFTELLKDLFVDTGIISEKDRIEIIHIEGENYSDQRRIEINCYKGRKKTPFIYWNICFDIVRDLVYWDYSTFCRY